MDAHTSPLYAPKLPMNSSYQVAARSERLKRLSNLIASASETWYELFIGGIREIGREKQNPIA
jgi:hypothetical protein